MKLLLTGGTGYIGSHAAVALLQSGHEVLAFDNLSNSQADVVERVRQISGRPVAFVRGDVRDEALLARCMREYAVDAVMHFAGLKAVGTSVANPLAYYENNVGGTLSLLGSMRAAGVRRLVFSSSATVYGEPDYLPLDEAHPLRPANPYGRSKQQVEQVLMDLVAADPDWRIASLRYFNPVGAHESGLLGEAPSGVPDNLMPFVAEVAAGRRDCLRIFGQDYPTADGTGVRDYIHVMDLVDGHLAALDFLAEQAGMQVFNLGTGRGHSVLELVAAFERVSGRAVPYQMTDRRVGDVAACYASAKKARTMLGWQARRSLDDMCASSWRWQVHREA